MPLAIHRRLPGPEEYNRLRTSVGWPAADLIAAAASLPKSLFSVCAFLDDSLVGMARVVGDGGLVFYIQDVIVLPEHQ